MWARAFSQSGLDLQIQLIHCLFLFLLQEDIAGLKHIPHGGPGYSDFFPVTACIDIEKSELLDGYYSLYQTQGCAYTLKLYGIDVMDEFKYYPPSIEIYPTVDLPYD